MRVHFGTKIGKKSYIGASGNPGKAAGGCFKVLFLWPLLMVYYICIWPFVALVRWLKNRSAQKAGPCVTSAVKAVPAGRETNWRNIKAWKWWQWTTSVFAALFAICVIGGIGDTVSEGGSSSVPSPTPSVTITAVAAKKQREEMVIVASPRITAKPAMQPTSSPTVAPAITPESTAEKTPSPTTTVAPVMGYVNAESLNLRSEPSKNAAILGEYDGGQTLEILCEDGEWYKVAIGSAIGYMAREYVGLGMAPSQAASTITVKQHTGTVDEFPSDELNDTAVEEHDKGRGTVYWVKNGEVYHSTSECASLKRSKNIYSGSVAEAQAAGKARSCNLCY